MPGVLRPGLEVDTATALRDTARRLKAAEQQLRHTADAVERGPTAAAPPLLYAAEEYLRAIESHRAAMSAFPERKPEPPGMPPVTEAGRQVASGLTRSQLQELGEAALPPGTPRLDPITEEGVAHEIARLPAHAAATRIVCGSTRVEHVARRIVGSAHGVVVDDGMDPDGWRVEAVGAGESAT